MRRAPPDFVLMCSVASTAPQQPPLRPPPRAGRGWGRPHPLVHPGCCGLPWGSGAAWGQRCCLAPSEPTQFFSQALRVGGFRLCPAGTGCSAHCTCGLSSGAEAKVILPKKEKLKLRRERWLQSKCIPRAPGGNATRPQPLVEDRGGHAPGLGRGPGSTPELACAATST